MSRPSKADCAGEPCVQKFTATSRDESSCGGDGDVGHPRAQVGRLSQQRGLEILALIFQHSEQDYLKQSWRQTLSNIMATPSDKADIPLQRFQGLYIKVDTPKGRLDFPPTCVRHGGAYVAIGRGVFATKVIPAKTVIEVCPVLILGLEENKTHIEHTSLYHYT